jgi:hypothetical protein
MAAAQEVKVGFQEMFNLRISFYFRNQNLIEISQEERKVFSANSYTMNNFILKTSHYNCS